MKKRLSCLILLLCYGCLAIAQSSAVKDSLLQVLKTAKDDTAKVRLLLNIEKLYSNKNYDSFYYYLEEARKLSSTLKTDQFDFFINAGYSEYYYYNNDYKKAIAYSLAGKDVAEKQSDMKLLAKSYNNLAAVYNHFGQHKLAIESILKCLDISEKTKDSISFPVRNLTASVTYFNLGQFDKAIEYAKKAIAFGNQFSNFFAATMGLNNLSASYSQLNMLDSAIITSKQQLDLARREEDVVNINYALINLCFDNFKKGDMAELDKYASQLITASKDFPDNQTLAQIQNALALNSIAKGNYPQAKNQLDSGINIAIKEDDADALQNLYKTYAAFYFTQRNIKEAEKFSFRYDSIISAENLRELNLYTEDLETKYQTEKKEAQIKLQQSEIKQRKNFSYFLIAGLAAVLIISLLAYRNYKHKQKLQQAKIDELETEKKLTATEAVLKGEEQERTRLAKDLHDGLGGMLSGIKHSLNTMKGNLIMTPDNAQAFERSIDMLDSSIKEMRRVAHNMMPEILVRYGLDSALKEFCSEITRSGVTNITYQSIGMEGKEIEQTTAVTIYRIVQELVNNAIKHAAAKNILVQAHATTADKLIALTVEDDGKGFDKTILNSAKGMGWSNIKSRVEFLKGKIDVHSEMDKGTSVLIEINDAG